MKKTRETTYRNFSSDYSEIGKKLCQIEEKIDGYGDYHYFVVNLLHKCETYYKENKKSKTPYMDGISFIDYQSPLSYNGLPLLFNIRIWNFKNEKYISHENTMYFSVPLISINDNITEISIDLPLVSGHYLPSSIEDIGRMLKKIPYQQTLTEYNTILALEERQTFDILLKDFRNVHSRKPVIEITVKNDCQILDFILSKNDKAQDILISMWLYAMNECASIYQNQITERDKMEINDDIIFEFNVLNGIGGGINKHGVEIFINKDISDAIK